MSLDAAGSGGGGRWRGMGIHKVIHTAAVRNGHYPLIHIFSWSGGATLRASDTVPA